MADLGEVALTMVCHSRPWLYIFIADHGINNHGRE